ncbi:MAG: hypothetical protein JKY65_18505 [Planctomycetes bacterium]|nr:hypothetical protein [Planctomycetota bacterium]
MIVRKLDQDPWTLPRVTALPCATAFAASLLWFALFPIGSLREAVKIEQAHRVDLLIARPRGRKFTLQVLSRIPTETPAELVVRAWDSLSVVKVKLKDAKGDTLGGSAFVLRTRERVRTEGTRWSGEDGTTFVAFEADSARELLVLLGRPGVVRRVTAKAGEVVDLGTVTLAPRRRGAADDPLAGRAGARSSLSPSRPQDGRDRVWILQLRHERYGVDQQLPPGPTVAGPDRSRDRRANGGYVEAWRSAARVGAHSRGGPRRRDDGDRRRLAVRARKRTAETREYHALLRVCLLGH